MGRPPVLTDSELACAAVAQSIRAERPSTTASSGPETRGSRAGTSRRYAEPMLEKVRQLIESVNDTLQGPARPYLPVTRERQTPGWSNALNCFYAGRT